MKKKDDGFKYEVIERFGVLSEGTKGWTTELCFVSWNDRDPKFDIRPWSPDKEKMGKGMTLTKEEIKALGILINKLHEDGKLD